MGIDVSGTGSESELILPVFCHIPIRSLLLSRSLPNKLLQCALRNSMMDLLALVM